MALKKLPGTLGRLFRHWSHRTIQAFSRIADDAFVCQLFTFANPMQETKECFALFYLSMNARA
jgi:hypothetical protein